MVRHPKTLIDFMQMYPTEEDCRQAIFEHRSPHGFWCRAVVTLVRGTCAHSAQAER